MFIASARSAAWSLYRVQFIRVYVVEDRMSDARARAPCRRDLSPFASRDNELLCPVGRLLFGSRDVAMVIRETLLLSFFFLFLSSVLFFAAWGRGIRSSTSRFHLAHASLRTPPPLARCLTFQLEISSRIGECRTHDTNSTVGILFSILVTGY